VRPPARDLGEPVVEQRRERFAVEIDRSRRALAQTRHHVAAALAERTLVATLPVLGLAVERAAG